VVGVAIAVDVAAAAAAVALDVAGVMSNHCNC